MNEGNQAPARRRAVCNYYDVKRVSALLDMSERWVRQQISDGQLEAFLLGNKLVVSSSSINEFLDKRRVTTNAAA